MAKLEQLKARIGYLLPTAQEETANIDLFAPITEREECPICMLPFPISGPMDRNEFVFMTCCGKYVCRGCLFRITMDEKKKGIKYHDTKCTHCRLPRKNRKSTIQEVKRLMKHNNPDVFLEVAGRYRVGEDGVFQSNTKSLEMYIRAAELGNAEAYYMIGAAFIQEGIVVERDESKTFEFWKVAAKKGSIYAHRELGLVHKKNGNISESIRHWKVAASAGDQESITHLMKSYKEKELSKEGLSKILRAFQISSNEMKSKDRDEANVYIKEHRMS